MSMLTVADVKDDVKRVLGGADDAVFYNRLNDAVEILEKGIVHQPVEMAVDGGIAVPGFPIRDQAQAGPATVAGQGIAHWQAVLAAADVGNGLECHKQNGAFIAEKRPMAAAHGLEMPGILANLFDLCQPAGPVWPQGGPQRAAFALNGAIGHLGHQARPSHKTNSTRALPGGSQGAVAALRRLCGFPGKG